MGLVLLMFLYLDRLNRCLWKFPPFKPLIGVFFFFLNRGSDDKQAYVGLLKELRTAFEGEAKTSGQPRLLLAAAVPASFEAIAAG